MTAHCSSLEAKITKTICTKAFSTGYTVVCDYGVEDQQEHSELTRYTEWSEELLSDATCTGMCNLEIYGEDKQRICTIALVYGNEEDLVSDGYASEANQTILDELMDV